MSAVKTAIIQGLSSANPNVIVSNDGTISLGSASVSKSTNGYLKLPDGMIIQWGLAISGTTTNFPIAFPNYCLSVGSSIVLSASGATITWSQASLGFTNTGITMYSGGANQQYIAIGY